MSNTDHETHKRSKKQSTETTPLVDDDTSTNSASPEDDKDSEESTVPQASATSIGETATSETVETKAVEDEAVSDAPEEAEIPTTGDAGQEAYSTETLSEDDKEDDNPHVNIGSVRLREQLVVTEQKSGTRFTFPKEEITEIIIGRRSTTVPELLHIDLGDLIEPTDGISRKHASIVRQDGLLFVVDRDSRNGTYLNGQKLVPEQLRIVRDSDLIRLGRVILIISYENLPIDNTAN